MLANTNSEIHAGDSSRIENSIAVVGLGCRYPGADSPKELWQNILSRRVQFREIPDCRLPLSEYHNSDASAPDKTYGTRAAVIDGYAFDWSGKRIPKSAYEATDIAHWLALDTTLQMLENTRHGVAGLPKERTSVVIGNTLTGEFTRAGTLRLRWPFVKKSLALTARQCGIPERDIALLEQRMEANFKSVFPPTNEDSLAGGLANTIAGRICNFLDLNGGGYTVDGACSSSLIAIYTAATQLISGAADFVIAGGVDVSLDPFELIGFAKTGALTKEEMRVYDRRGKGFIPGEGCGIVGLKRLDDAERDGDKIYAVLKGWGLSSDGKGGITAPSAKGQSMALRRAYEQAKLSPSELDFIEGHGTGTTVGDRIEILGIASAMGEMMSEAGRKCGLTSLKSLVGHTKAAAGVGAFIKTVMAVNQRVLPPTNGCFLPHEEFSKNAGMLYPIRHGRQLPKDSTLHAGVSAMGFGGINSHVVLASGPAVLDELQTTLAPEVLFASQQNSELFIFKGSSFAEVLAQIEAIAPEVKRASYAEVTDIAAELARRVMAKTSNEHVILAAVTALTPFEFADRLQRLAQRLHESIRQGNTLGQGALPPLSPADQQEGIYLSSSYSAPRVAFVFPGQGSQQINMARMLVDRYQWAKDLVAQANECFASAGAPGVIDAVFPSPDTIVSEADTHAAASLLRKTEIAQPALVLCSVLWLKYLEKLGLQPDAVMGHSLGELVAFYAAGCFDEKALFTLAVIRGKQMAQPAGSAPGSMASVMCDQKQAQDLISIMSATATVVIANINSPRQTVVSGVEADIDEFVSLATQKNIRAVKLPVSNAFHSPLVQEAADYIAENSPLPKDPQAVNCSLISSIDGKEIDAQVDLVSHFSQQIIKPVDFIAATKSLIKTADVVIEVGAGKVLSKLVQANTDNLMTCFPIAGEPHSYHDVNTALAVLFVSGAKLNWRYLYADRLVKEYRPPSQLEFLRNPCEREMHDGNLISKPGDSHGAEGRAPWLHTTNIDQSTLQRYLARRGDFIEQVIQADMLSQPTLDTDTAVSDHSLGLVRPVAVVDTSINTSVKNPEISRVGFDDDQARAASPSAKFPQASNSSPERRGALDLLMSAIQQKTGFEKSSITSNLSLLDDLNLDSIKAGELISGVAMTLGMEGTLDPLDFVGRSVGDIAEAMESLLPKESGPVMASGGTTSTSTAYGRDALTAIVVAISEKTGFDKQSISPELSLLDDLNLDSIKAGELVGNVALQLGLDKQIDPVDYIAASVGELAHSMQSMLDALPGHRQEDHQQRTDQAAYSAHGPAQHPSASLQAGLREVLVEGVLDLLISAIATKTGFERSSISPELNLLDDLNLDSIKAGELIAEVALKFNADKDVDPLDLVSASVVKIATEIHKKIPKDIPPSKQEKDLRSPTSEVVSVQHNNQKIHTFPVPAEQTWVRAFALHRHEIAYTDGDKENKKSYLSEVSDSDVAVVHDTSHKKLARDLVKQLKVIGVSAAAITFTDISAEIERHNYGHLMVLLPAVENSSAAGEKTLRQSVEQLVSISASATKLGERCESVSFVQMNSDVSSENVKGSTDSTGVAPFAASFHLENPAIKVRVIDCAYNWNAKRMADVWLSEVAIDGHFEHVTFDKKDKRYAMKPQPLDLSAFPKRDISWTKSDVIIATGGAKGITAECCLAFAQSKGVSMALVGSSPLPDPDDSDNEINITLTRFREREINAHYYACDITDKTKLKELVERISSELGEITGVIHGAGLNKPRRSESVAADDAYNEIGPKVLGAYNLCDVLVDAPLKLYLGFTSIIGVTGMPGNSWYAYANSMLHHILKEYELRRPTVQTLCLAYSVWGDVGMGAKLGSVKGLAKKGIMAIPTAQGVAKFLSLCEHKVDSSQVVVTARLAGLDTWRPQLPSLPSANRFLQNIVSLHPGVELICRTHLSLQDDLYLADHNYRGSYLFPTVLGLEAMAQGVAYVTGRHEFSRLRLENIQLRRPIVVDKDVGANIEIRIIVGEQQEAGDSLTDDSIPVSAAIYTEQSSYSRAHFSADFMLPRNTKAGSQSTGEELLFFKPKEKLDIDPKLDLYGGLLFQGKLFQRLDSVYAMDYYGAVSSARYESFPHPQERFFSEKLSNEMILGDPAFRDVLLQSAQLSDKGIFLPIEIVSLEIVNQRNASPGIYFIDSKVINRRGDELTCAIHAYNSHGALHERLTGYNLKRLEYDEAAPRPEDWADPGARDEIIFSQAVEKHSENLAVVAPQYVMVYAPKLSDTPKDIRHIAQLPLFFDTVSKVLAQGKGHADQDRASLADKMEVHWTMAGKPFIEGRGVGDISVSLSHDVSHCLCVAGKSRQGCDIEVVEQRSAPQWLALLGNARGQLLADLQNCGDSMDQAGARLWTATEAFIKAFSEKPKTIQLQRYVNNAFLLKCMTDTHECLILTFSVLLTRPRPKMVAMLVSPEPTHAPRPSATTIKKDGEHHRNQEQSLAVTASNNREEKAARLPQGERLERDVYSYMNYGPNGEMQPSFRFRATFKDTRTLSRKLNFPIYASWMGKIREVSILDVADELVPDFASGRWGMVTNSSNLVVVGQASCLDIIEGRTWISKIYGRHNSTVDMHFDWIKVGEGGSEKRIAYSNMTTTWVEIKSHGLVEVAPLPPYLQEFLNKAKPTVKNDDTALKQARSTLPEELKHLSNSGRPLYQAPPSPVVEPVLVEQLFYTTLEESNLVGNIYYAHYYEWQSRVLDRYLYSIIPQHYRGTGDDGELFCIKNEVQHVREAMPLDTIKVKMALKEFYETGLVLHFDFYSEGLEGKWHKLAFGTYHGVWVRKDQELGDTVAAYLPKKLREHLQICCSDTEVLG